ncbi:MAG: glycosyltransferase [Candidatus Dadabacteria bacterium]|nr:MAG: glycosyltransferase [Candidatus Dadabacteria bacterium]
MRICIVTTSYPRFEGDDAGIFVERFVKALSPLVDSVLIIAPRDKDEPAYEKDGNIEIKRVEYWLPFGRKIAYGQGIPTNLKRNPLLAVQVPFLLLAITASLIRERQSYDFVLASWIFSGVAAWIASIFTKISYIITLKGTDMKLLEKKLFSSLVKKPLINASYVVSVSRPFVMEPPPHMASTGLRLIFVPNGVDIPIPTEKEIEEFRKAKSFPADDKNIIFVGTHHPGKNILFLLHTVSHPLLSDFNLILCGRISDDSYKKEIYETIERLKIAQRVRIEGAVSPNEIPLYLSVSEYYMTASKYEGMPNAVLEAMSAGLVVLASDIKPHRELIEDGKSGIIFSDDIEALAKRIDRLEKNPEQKAKLSENARKRVEPLTWDATAKMYLKLIGTER